ncbi:PIG-L family deacetylase [Streptomyces sp. 891-h]|uniref:PIG-L family deacetylase n=1 Tax=Streptomyces sp. 891-h TaxID=2720714 RepID=UPI001FA9EC75|nr:PIG-L family deacetylase [Streptomyces sp. 891-h]
MPLIPRAVAGRRRAGKLLAPLCALGLLAGLTGCAHGGADRSGRQRASGPDQAAPVPTGTWAGAGRPVRTAESVLQIVAHPDDDLYFVNPETAQSLRSGRPLTTVYLTSGESDGVNAPRKSVPGAAASAHKPHAHGDKAPRRRSGSGASRTRGRARALERDGLPVRGRPRRRPRTTRPGCRPRGGGLGRPPVLGPHGRPRHLAPAPRLRRQRRRDGAG